MKLYQLITEALSLDSTITIRDDHGPGTLDGWDSLGHVKIITSLESTYNIPIDMNEVIAIETVGDIKNLLKEKGITEM